MSGRYVVVGAGAVGGLLGVVLQRAGAEVTLVARGDNLAAIRERGLRLVTPDADVVSDLAVAGSLDEAAVTDEDVVIVAVKGQDTLAVVRDLASRAARAKVVCAQNGVENERVALRHFDDVYAMCVITPATHLEPGVVAVHAAGAPGVFDLGRWPGGVDDLATRVASEITAGGAIAEAREEIALLKWGKLLSNVHNAHEALVGDLRADSEVVSRTREEALEVMRAAGVDVERAESLVRERFSLLRHGAIEGVERQGGSTWQSLRRGTGDAEGDYLNGEIALLGRLHDVATPVNVALQRLVVDAARHGRGPGSLSDDEILAHAR